MSIKRTLMLIDDERVLVESEREAGLTAGMDGYMTKPLNLKRLESIILELIEKKSRA